MGKRIDGVGDRTNAVAPSFRTVGHHPQDAADHTEPRDASHIAIVGMACRFPGAPDIDAYWRLLESGTCAVTEGVPGSGPGRVAEIFPPKAAADACRFGAFVEDIDLFDASFFRISPVEARLLDPQQRMMLETSWHALEDAGIDPDSLRGGRVAVCAGMSTTDYRSLALESFDTSDPAQNLYIVSGTPPSTAIGRVAFVLGLAGPAMTIDTACSSSLVAIQQAVVSLQRNESDLALAGGVQALLFGRMTELRAHAQMLSPDGRCHTFDAAANGFVRGEGCGMVVLKRLADARKDGDPIWGVVRGIAVNQDGASTGLTVPSGEAQQAVIREALDRAGLTPADVDYLEAHGTGTEVGDPIEMSAAGTAYSDGRAKDRPLLVGSVKTNIGHLEAAAGIAGFIKAVLAVGRRVIPKHLNFHSPNPKIDWDRLPVRVCSSTNAWPVEPGRPARAGINSFGLSGTNAHAVVEAYASSHTPFADSRVRGPCGPPIPIESPLLDSPSESATQTSKRRRRFLPLSGKSDAALRDLAAQYLEWLSEWQPSHDAPDGLLADMAWSAGIGRSHFAHRAGVAFDDAASLREGLMALCGADDAPQPRTANRTAFVYTGQGSHWVGMGADLYTSEPVARATLDRCEAIYRQLRGTSLLDTMFGRPDATGDLDNTAWQQPAIYALECALTALWASVGVRPDAVMGHSLGEFAAAQASGMFTLETGMRLVTERAASMAELPEGGAMAAVFAPEAEVASEVDAHNGAARSPVLWVAARNGAQSVVSGPASEVESVAERFRARDIRVQRLKAQVAFHSGLVEPMLDELEALFEGVELKSPSIAFVSNLSGRALAQGDQLDGGYWRRQARQTVEFARGVEALAEMEVDTVVELGPHAVLGPMASMAWPENGPGAAATPTVLSSLRRPQGDGEVLGAGFADSVATAYEAGLKIDFRGLFTGERRRRVSLPVYPFQRSRHWIESPRRHRSIDGHHLLGMRHETPSGAVHYEAEIAATNPTWLSDHRVFDRVVAPAAMYGGMAVSATLAEWDGAESAVLEEMQLYSPLVFPKDADEEETGHHDRRLHLSLDPAASPSGAGSRRVEIYSRGTGDSAWMQHVECQVRPGEPEPAPGQEQTDIDALKASLSQDDMSAVYRNKMGSGINFGPSFRSVQAVWSGTGEAVGEVALPEHVDSGGLPLHPILLDGCFQVVAAARGAVGVGDETTWLPFGCDRLWFHGAAADRIFCHVRMSNGFDSSGTDGNEELPEILTADLRFYDPSGSLRGGIDGFAMKRATRMAMLSAGDDINELLYEFVWREDDSGTRSQASEFLPEPTATADAVGTIEQFLAAEGVSVKVLTALRIELERLARAYAFAALSQLGWDRMDGGIVDPDDLSDRLQVSPSHRRLLGKLLGMLVAAGVLAVRPDGRYAVVPASDESHPEDPARLAEQLGRLYPDGSSQIRLVEKCGRSLAEVLQGRTDPLSVIYGDDDDQSAAGAVYNNAPMMRATLKMLARAIANAVADLPAGMRLRVLEVGAGVGSATAHVLPELPPGRFEYTYTDISAGFFAAAEQRFENFGESMRFGSLDIETDPIGQGFDAHRYDLIVAVNVLHATRDIASSLAHCRRLLAPSGQLMAVESFVPSDWLDLTFGQLPGWWRFADNYRRDNPLAPPDVWRRALSDAGFSEVQILGQQWPGSPKSLDRGVIVAQVSAEFSASPGLWILAADRSGAAATLATMLTARDQTVVLAGDVGSEASKFGPGILPSRLAAGDRVAWRSLLEGLPREPPLRGVVHLAALDGDSEKATPADLAGDVERTAASALALVQGLLDAETVPSLGLWFVTRGAQVLERERGGQLAGATVWGIGKVVAREAAQLQPRMIDLDPTQGSALAQVADELLSPDAETHIAWRGGVRKVARLVRGGRGTPRLTLPEDSDWRLARDPSGTLDELRVEPPPDQPLKSGEVRVAVEASSLNYVDLIRSLVEMAIPLGRELCGEVVETAPGVTGVAVGDRVVGYASGSFSSKAVTHASQLVVAPPGIPSAALATIPVAFSTAILAFEQAALKVGERVLIHAGAGGLGLSAIQVAQAIGAEVFATASEPKWPRLHALGVKHVFDSRSTEFGQEILETTGGTGVDVVLNSLTGPGFIEASLNCLVRGGRFVEVAKRDIWSERRMNAERPDVDYRILDLGTLLRTDPDLISATLVGVMERVSRSELTPVDHSLWPMAEAQSAIDCMRTARHIGKIALAPSPLAQGRLKGNRTYLITGGLGGLGLVTAGWLADRGAGAIVLNGRRAPDSEAENLIASLRERGTRIEVELADVSDGSAVAAMLERVGTSLPPLGGVFHSVGVLSDAALSNQSWEGFKKVLWPKVMGAWHLHRATIDLDLDLFVLFSSVTGVLGTMGQANHAAANVFLDQLAAHRRALGLPGQSIAWGAWSGLGEAEEQRGRISRHMEARGTGWISPQQGLRALDRLVRQDLTMGVVATVDWPTLASHGTRRLPQFEELLTVDSPSGARETDVSPSNLLARLRSTALAERAKLLAQFLQDELQALLRLPSAPSPSVGLFDLGLDSLMAVEFRNRLNRALEGEYKVSRTAVFDHSNVTQLARHLAGELRDLQADHAVEAAGSETQVPGEVADVGTETPEVWAGAAEEQAARPPELVEVVRVGSNEAADVEMPKPAAMVSEEGKSRTRTGRQAAEAIAVIGIACKFPGSENLAGYWNLLASGGDAIKDRRPDDDSGRIPTAGREPYSKGGYIAGIDRFDAEFFRVQPLQARTMDPRQRLLLETSWHALEDAGIDPQGLSGVHCGVYAGIGESEYRDLLLASAEVTGGLGTATSVAVGRIAFLLGVEGPTIPVNLACASSLVSVHQAITGLRSGETDLALAGGVNAILSPAFAEEMSDWGILSESGRCRAFDATADGFVRGEGCGVLVLKRLAEAEADGDQIRGVIRGSAVNHNGSSASLAVPRKHAQQQVIGAALRQAGLAPHEIDYLEAHGTGTAIGDVIEVEAAAAVYSKGRSANRPLLIGSVKTNIGHLEAAAGVAGLIKTLLAMEQRTIPQHLHFSRSNPDIDWDGLRVRVAADHATWPPTDGRPPRAGVSAFGMTGTNAHIVVEGYDAPGASIAKDAGHLAPAAAQSQGSANGGPGVRILPLSARSDAALRELAASYARWLDERIESSSEPAEQASLLADMAWTAGVGRSHFEHRAGIVFSDAESLRERLAALAAPRAAPSAPSRSSRESQRQADAGSIEAVARAYEAGRSINFAELFADERRRRISLPGYPFQRDRYWVKMPK